MKRTAFFALALALTTSSAGAQPSQPDTPCGGAKRVSLAGYYGLWAYEPGPYHPFTLNLGVQREKPEALTVYVSQCPGKDRGEISRQYFLFTGEDHSQRAERLLGAFTGDSRLECGEEVRSMFLRAADFKADLSMFFIDRLDVPLSEQPLWGGGEYIGKISSDRFDIVPVNYWLERPFPCVKDCWRDNALVTATSMLDRLGVHHGKQFWTLVETNRIEVSFEGRRGYAAQLYAYGSLSLKKIRSYDLPPCS